jgi:hypothetical protein
MKTDTIKLRGVFNPNEKRELVYRSYYIHRIVSIGCLEGNLSLFALNEMRIGNINQLCSSPTAIPMEVFLYKVSIETDVVEVGDLVSLTITNNSPSNQEIELEIIVEKGDRGPNEDYQEAL